MSKMNSSKNKNFFIINLQNFFGDAFFSILIFFIMIFILINPSKFSSGTINGVKLFFYNVLPGLFPFMFLTKLLTEIGFVYKISPKFSKATNSLFGCSGISFYAFLMSILSGYPIGSKIIYDLYSKNLITQNEAKKMSVFCTTSGPIFIIGAVGVSMLKSFKLGIIIYVSHIISSIILGLFAKLIYKEKNKNLMPQHITTNKPQNLFSNCIAETVNSILIVGAYITIFFIISELLETIGIFRFITNLTLPFFQLLKIDKNSLSGILYGMVEVTRGCKVLSLNISNLSVSLICSIISFSGLSIIMQSMNYLKQTQIKMHSFILTKAMHAILSFFVCYTLIFFIA